MVIRLMSLSGNACHAPEVADGEKIAGTMANCPAVSGLVMTSVTDRSGSNATGRGRVAAG